jgi:hypothetical protein
MSITIRCVKSADLQAQLVQVFLSDSSNETEECCISVCVLLNSQRHLSDLIVSQCTLLAIRK